ncbi:hypothetical protein HanIR_Chr15g0737511 [Helianthus annuus]|nr:hypothetical protein HanIR_Chr15g0737511 [Helianthus annuus]
MRKNSLSMYVLLQQSPWQHPQLSFHLFIFLATIPSLEGTSIFISTQTEGALTPFFFVSIITHLFISMFGDSKTSLQDTSALPTSCDRPNKAMELLLHRSSKTIVP